MVVDDEEIVGRIPVGCTEARRCLRLSLSTVVRNTPYAAQGGGVDFHRAPCFGIHLLLLKEGLQTFIERRGSEYTFCCARSIFAECRGKALMAVASGAMEDRHDDEFGFVKRDTVLLERAIKDEGRKTSTTSSDNNTTGSEGVGQEEPTSGPTAADPPVGQHPAEDPQVSSQTSSVDSSDVSHFGGVNDPTKKIEDIPTPVVCGGSNTRDVQSTPLWPPPRHLKSGTVLPMVKLVVSKEGVAIAYLGSQPNKASGGRFHAIDTVSYGVQDLVYTRVFSMIIVRETGGGGGSAAQVHPFECHAFVCDSRDSARRLTYALAAAFNEYSKTVKKSPGDVKKKFAIDLRTPEEIEAELQSPNAPDDSEA
uniref:PID domain-containing protein n=1 Tax=Timema genevievae TaxID=629358 RepID=A0A7R9JNL5_TIMGE|nr:unnamed protein product [Timema genevievae]